VRTERGPALRRWGLPIAVRLRDSRFPGYAARTPEIGMPTLFRRSVLLAAIAGCGGGAFAQPSFTGLGDLPGGQVYSDAWGVSADGSAVVGSSIINGNILFGGTYAAFRWTAATGIVDIYDLGGIGTVCRAFAANGDGSVVVGMADC